MNKVLYLPIETIVRDLEGNLLLGYEALKRGYDIFLGPKDESVRFATHVGSGIYLSKHWEGTFPYPFAHEIRENYCYIGFHPEGLVYHTDEFFAEKMNVTGKSEKLDINFVYGRVQRKLLEEKNPLLKNILCEVGHPRFDLLRPEYHYLYGKEVNRIKKKYGKYILINTSFTSGNTAKFYKKSYIDRKNEESLKKWGKPLDPEEIDFLTRRIQYYEELVKVYLEMISEMAPRVGECEIIVRPHPSENHEVYHHALSGIPNVKVIHEGNVVNWILGAEAVIQTGCTTAIEAWASRKPVIRYNPIERAEEFESSLPNQLGIHVTDIDKLISQLNRVFSGDFKDSFTDQIDIAKPLIESIDGKPSYQLIMDKIDEVIGNNVSDRGVPDEKIQNYFNLSDKTDELKTKFIRFLRQQKWIMELRHDEEMVNKRLAQYQKFPGLSKRFITNYFDQLSRLDPENTSEKITYSRVDVDSFLLRIRKNH